MCLPLLQQQLVQLTVAPNPAQVAPGALLPIVLSVHNTTGDALRGHIVAHGWRADGPR